MPADLLLKLLGIFAVVGFGWAVGRAGWIDAGSAPGAARASVARVLASAAFVLFMPALLFRTTARIDIAALPWRVLAVFFVPLLGVMLGVYLWQRRRLRRAGDAAGAAGPAAAAGGAGPGGAVPNDGLGDDDPAAVPAVRAMSVGFGNTVQLGIPVAAALFGEAGLAVHLAIVSLHSLVILTLMTALVEADLAHAHARRGGTSAALGALLFATARRTVIHPVVLPVVAGLAWNLTGWPLPSTVDEALALLAQAAVPLCLVIIGLSFAEEGLAGLRAAARPAVGITLAKLLGLPLIVLGASWLARLDLPTTAVLVMCAALPTGSNALIFAQRYRALGGEVSVATVLSTLAYAVTAPLWLLLLGALGSG